MTKLSFTLWVQQNILQTPTHTSTHTLHRPKHRDSWTFAAAIAILYVGVYGSSRHLLRPAVSVFGGCNECVEV